MSETKKTKKTGGWTVVGEMLLALFGFYVHAATSGRRHDEVVFLSGDEIEGGQWMGVSQDELRKNGQLRAEARLTSSLMRDDN